MAILTAEGWTCDPIAPVMPPAQVEAVRSLLLSDMPPNPEASTPAAGVGDKASRESHSHPTISSRTKHTLDSNGLATCMFTRSFPVEPVIGYPLYTETGSGQPVMFRRESWVMSGPNFVGVVIRGLRLQVLPGVSLNLLGFNVSGGSAAGISFDLIALPPSG